MSHAWFLREASGTTWVNLSVEAGVINGSASVADSVETDLVLVWMDNGSVESDLALLWQLDASPITSVESSVSFTWNIIVEAGTTVDADLLLLWQRGGSVETDLSFEWAITPIHDVRFLHFHTLRNSVLSRTGHADYRATAQRHSILARAA